MLAWAVQLAVVAGVIAVGVWLFDNYQANSDRQNIATDLDYLDQPANFPIPSNPDFRQSQPVKDAVVEGIFNSLRLVVVGVILATVLGTLLGVARLSKNFLVKKASQVYVEFIRNVPLLSLLFVFYLAVVLDVFPNVQDTWELGPLAVLNVRGANLVWFEGSNVRFAVIVIVALAVAWLVARWRRLVFERTGSPARSGLWAAGALAVAVAALWLILEMGGTTPQLDGRRVTGGIAISPPYFAALLALVIYTSSHIAEIVRGSIQAVAKGQGEAADALALSGFQRMWFVVLPQAMRIALPPIGNQYLNLAKNSSLAAVFSFPEMTKITELAINQQAPAIPAYVLLLLMYLALSLMLSLIVNLANRRMAIVER